MKTPSNSLKKPAREAKSEIELVSGGLQEKLGAKHPICHRAEKLGGQIRSDPAHPANPVARTASTEGGRKKVYGTILQHTVG